MRYAVVLHKDKRSVFGVTVPDVPGCFSAGKTVEEALENAVEAIYAHLELLSAEGQEVPEPKSIEDHTRNADFADGTFALVEVDVDSLIGPAERINLTVPKRALAKIDAAARKLGDSRSGFMTKASMNYISKTLPPEALLVVSSMKKLAKAAEEKIMT